MDAETEFSRQDYTAYPYVCVGCRALLRENGGLCPSCFRSGLIFARYRRVADDFQPQVPCATAKDLVTSVSHTFSLETCPGLILGPSAFVGVHGAPGGGKTTLALKIADELSPSIFLPLEMGLGPLLASMLQRLEIVSPEVEFHEPRGLPEIFALAQHPQAHCLVIDSLSVSTLRPDDVRSIARANNIVVIGTLQETKNGSFRGSNEWLHAADVMVSVENMRWTVSKSRYQAPGLEGEVCASATV